ncbi:MULTISPECIES: hypothetical protein [unclassified Paraburkholderia]|uniref:hypothetical protein n=1 Tax=unclassified Paraburkholderia TaxID=2615204 RepID=UPI00160A4824|nr:MULTISPECIES: hypothetical protein [unclassified Paraburkholderia]MBB5448411.1 hypothetical protein [Paraburkholderia sp. WSM4177]MBB5488793.1 hypothetical protein [Paraburkholderia sp. WSM4180]
MEAVFEDVVHALRYAYSFNSQQYGKSLMARMYGPPGSGRGLSGIDGAGQAGFVLAEVEKLPLVQQAVLFVRYSPPDFPCSCGADCCSGHRPNKAWNSVIEWLVTHHVAVLLPGCMRNVRLHRELVRNALTRTKSEYKALGKQYGVHPQTVAKHAVEIETALVGSRRQAGEMDKALVRADGLLREVGIVGEVIAA